MASGRKNLRWNQSTDFLTRSPQPQRPLAGQLVRSSTVTSSKKPRTDSAYAFYFVAHECLDKQTVMGLRRAVLQYHHEEERKDATLRHSWSTTSFKMAAGGTNATKCALKHDGRQWTAHRHSMIEAPATTTSTRLPLRLLWQILLMNKLSSSQKTSSGALSRSRGRSSAWGCKIIEALQAGLQC